MDIDPVINQEQIRQLLDGVTLQAQTHILPVAKSDHLVIICLKMLNIPYSISNSVWCAMNC